MEDARVQTAEGKEKTRVFFAELIKVNVDFIKFI